MLTNAYQIPSTSDTPYLSTAPKIRPFARNRDRRRNARPREGRDHHIARAEQQYGMPLAFSYFYRRLIRTLLQREVGFLKEKRRMNGMSARALRRAERTDTSIVAMTRAKRHLVSLVQAHAFRRLTSLFALPVRRRRLVDSVSRRELPEKMACVAGS